MSEFYIETNSFAAPFFSDAGHKYVTANTAADALKMAADTYTHPAGLYSAAAYSSADAKNKGEKPLAQWLCNHEAEKQRLTADISGYSYFGHGVGDFEINGVRHKVKNPREGTVVAANGESDGKR